MDSYILSRVAIAAIWIYQGLVPKLLCFDPTELYLIEKGPVIGSAQTMLVLAGLGEIAIGLSLFVFWKRAWPVNLSLAAFSVLLLGAIVLAPELATQAFNPITLTGAAIVLCLIQRHEIKRRRNSSAA